MRINISATTTCQDLLGLLKHLKLGLSDTAEANGLTSIQMYALHAMKDGGMSMGQLAQTLICDASNVTGIVDRLEALALIIRQDNAQDRRVKTLCLTEKGQQVIRNIELELPKRLGCTRLNAEERLSLQAVITKLKAV